MKKGFRNSKSNPQKRTPLKPRFYLYWFGILIFAAGFTNLSINDLYNGNPIFNLKVAFHLIGAASFCYALAEQAAVFIAHRHGRMDHTEAMRYAGFIDRRGSWSALLLSLTFVVFGWMTIANPESNVWNNIIGWIFILGFGYFCILFILNRTRKK